MTRAYKESYLNKAQKTLAAMMVYAVSDLNYEPDEFFMLFLQSRLVDEFGRGNPKYIAGKSGVELAREVILITTGQSVDVIPAPQSRKWTNTFWRNGIIVFARATQSIFLAIYFSVMRCRQTNI